MVSILGGAGAGALVSVVIKAIDNYSKEFDKLNKKVKQQQTSFQKLSLFLKSSSIGYAALAGAVLAYGVNVTKMAIQSERSFQQFNLALGDSANLMLNDMRKASHGLVSDLELVNNANRALALGISKNKIPALLEAATARAKIFGRTATEAFADISIGIGRQSRLILDNLGIILDLDQTYRDYAYTIGKTVDQLTEFEKKLALTNAILKESETLVKAQIFLAETHADKLERLGATYDNVKSALGLYILSVFDEISGLKLLEEIRQNQIDSMTGIPGTYDAVSRSVMDLGTAQKTLTDNLKASNDQVQVLINSLLDLKGITFEGERENNLHVLQTKKRINELEQEIDLRKQLGEAFYNIEGEGSMKDLNNELSEQKFLLSDLMSEQESMSLDRQIQQAQNAVDLERIGELESETAEITKKNSEDQVAQIESIRVEQEKIRTKLGEIKKAEDDLLNVFVASSEIKEDKYQAESDDIDELIRKTEELTKSYENAAKARSGISSGGFLSSVGKAIGRSFTGNSLFSKITSVGDAVLRPNGEVIKTHPSDTLIATKNPEGLGGGGTTIVFNGNIYGTDPEDIANAIQEQLKDKIST